jgi:glutamate dehydrogenase
MTIAIPVARQKLIERIATSSRRLRKRADPLPADEFIRQYYHGVAEEDLAEYRSEELAAAALAHLRFGSVRKPSQPLVRIYNAEEARDGWTSRHTVLEVVVEDMPFLVDSLGMVLTQAGLTIHMMVHPVLAVRRDRSGRLIELAEGDRTNGQYPSRVVAAHPDGSHRRRAARARAGAEDLPDAERRAGSRRRLANDASACRRGRAGDCAATAADRRERSARGEGAARVDGRQPFHVPRLSPVQLRRGRSEDVLEPLPDTGLGILRVRRGIAADPRVLTGENRERARQPELLLVTKANAMSTVHRSTHLDYVGVKTFDSSGRVTGEKRFLGLFTSAVYNRSPREIRCSGTRSTAPSRTSVSIREPRRQSRRARAGDLSARRAVPDQRADLIRTVRGIVNLYERQRVRCSCAVTLSAVTTRL